MRLSIVSVYCKCLLWVSIVSDFCVYCECPLGLVVLFVYLFRLRFIVFSSKNVEMLKNHWFYCVFAHKCWKSICFAVFLGSWAQKTLNLYSFYWYFVQQVAFLMRILVRKYKKNKKVKKSICFSRGKFFRMYKTISKFWFWWKSPNEMKTAMAKFSGWT